MIFNLPSSKQATASAKGYSTGFEAVAQSQSSNQRLYSMGTDAMQGAVESIIPKQPKALNELNRKIYQYDSVSGAAVDLMALLPFSDVSLTGVTDPKVLQVYQDCLSQLDIQTLMPQLAIEYMVIGKVIGTLIFNGAIGIFTDIIIQDPDSCTIENIPLQGYDPKIDIQTPPEFRKFLMSKDPRDLLAKEEIPKSLIVKLLAGKVPLESNNTLYLARKSFAKDTGTSYLSRVLPFYMLEQTLLQGTLNVAMRRQRSVLHIVAGDDEWDPTDDQLEDLIDLVISADVDPVGAVIATKKGVEIVEMARGGGNFWKITEDWDVINQAKMRALGINEALLSREANYNTMEQALSVFIETLRSFRSYLTNKIFFTKIFPLLARAHSFVKRAQHELDHNIRISGSKTSATDDIPIKDLIIPDVQWHKQLQPQYDQNYLDILSIVEEKGLPIPMRIWAAAGGFSMDKLLDSLDEDLDVQKQISAYKTSLKEIAPKEEAEFSALGYVPVKTLPKKRISSDKLKNVLTRAENTDPDLVNKVVSLQPRFSTSNTKSLVGAYSQ